MKTNHRHGHQTLARIGMLTAAWLGCASSHPASDVHPGSVLACYEITSSVHAPITILLDVDEGTLMLLGSVPPFGTSGELYVYLASRPRGDGEELDDYRRTVWAEGTTLPREDVRIHAEASDDPISGMSAWVTGTTRIDGPAGSREVRVDTGRLTSLWPCPIPYP